MWFWGLLFVVHYLVFVWACRYGLQGWDNVYRLRKIGRVLWRVFVPYTLLTLPLFYVAWRGVGDVFLVPPILALCGLVLVAWPIHRAWRKFLPRESV